MINKMLAVLVLPYAWSESMFPNAYIRPQYLEFLKLGLRVSISLWHLVIVASGDCGALCFGVIPLRADALIY
jgi:hypothetical protein